MGTPNYTELAEKAMSGQHDGLWMAVYDFLHRAPENRAECEQALREFAPADLALYTESQP